VRLIEIPTPNEVNDNIVAMWTPEGGVRAGDELGLDYTIHWGLTPRAQSAAATAVSTRAGHAGVAGAAPTPDARKFVVDFAGGAIDALPEGADLRPEITVIGGEIMSAVVVKRADGGAWRAIFDVRRNGREAVEMRCFLRFGDVALTETWSAQWTD
jgi:glucans biosynthesis protein